MERLDKMTFESVYTKNKLSLIFDTGSEHVIIQSVGFIDRMEHYSWSELHVNEGGGYWTSKMLSAEELKDKLNGFMNYYQLSQENYEAIELFFK